MGFLIALVALYRAWTRLAEGRAGEGVGGVAAIAFWLFCGVVLAFGSFTSLFVVLLPLGLGLLVISGRFDPTRSWLLLLGLVAVPSWWLATGSIDAGPVGWAVVMVGVVAVVTAAVTFETGDERTHA